MKTLNDHIEINPKILVGKPVIAGTRIAVDLILGKLAHGENIEGILEDYPQVTRDDIQAVMQYAQNTIKKEEIYPLRFAHD